MDDARKSRRLLHPRVRHDLPHIRTLSKRALFPPARAAERAEQIKFISEVGITTRTCRQVVGAAKGPWSHHVITRELANQMQATLYPELPQDKQPVRSIVLFDPSYWTIIDVDPLMAGFPAQRLKCKVWEGRTDVSGIGLFIMMPPQSQGNMEALSTTPDTNTWVEGSGDGGSEGETYVDGNTTTFHPHTAPSDLAVSSPSSLPASDTREDFTGSSANPTYYGIGNTCNCYQAHGQICLHHEAPMDPRNAGPPC